MYDIRWMGVKVAECSSEISDTLIEKKLYIKLDYKVESFSFMKVLFNITNHYTTIIDPNNYKIIFYSKKTSQPNLINQVIKTIYRNKKVMYLDTNYAIDENEKIFLVYFIYYLKNKLVFLMILY